MNLIVTVKPRSKDPGVQQTGDRSFTVRVSEPAHEGRANAAALTALAAFMKIAPSRFAIVRGARSKHKVVEVI